MKEQFLAHLPKDGTGIGNGSLMKLLNWDQATYDSVKDSLVQEGTIALGRGRGGSVKLTGTAPIAKPVSEPVRVAKSEVANEVTSEAVTNEVETVNNEAETVNETEVIEKPKLEDEEEARSAADPVVAAVDNDEKAAKVIAVLQQRYKKTRFYTVPDGEYVKVRIQLRDFGGLKQSLSPDILETARQIAADAVDPEKDLEKTAATNTPVEEVANEEAGMAAA